MWRSLLLAVKPAHNKGFLHTNRDIVLFLCSGELSQMDAMHLHVLLYESKRYLFLINYLFIIASYESCFYELIIVDKYIFIDQIQNLCYFSLQ